jgi:Mrp family chromosome partitioning ATPase
MGRTLQALRKTSETTGDRVAAPAVSEKLMAPATPAAAPVQEPDEVPYIEVGGPDRTIEASASVLGAKNRTSAATTAVKQLRLGDRQAQLPSADPVASAETLHITFQPLPDIHVPVLPAGKRFARELIAFHQPENPICDKYRTILKAMAPGKSSQPAPLVLLSAASSGAGTTTVLLNIAILAARLGTGPVVVVDANYRQPAIARLLGLTAGPGLRDVLAGRTSLNRVLRESGEPGLVVLGGGEETGAGSLHPGEQSIKAILRRLRQRCALVLVDGPSWDGGPELATLCHACDEVYLVLRPGEVGTPAVVKLMQLIPHLASSLGGFIVVQL